MALFKEAPGSVLRLSMQTAEWERNLLLGSREQAALDQTAGRIRKSGPIKKVTTASVRSPKQSILNCAHLKAGRLSTDSLTSKLTEAWQLLPSTPPQLVRKVDGPIFLAQLFRSLMNYAELI